MHDSATQEKLLADASWQSHLAQSLVGDPSTADDLAQETWVLATKRSARGHGQRRSAAPALRRVNVLTYRQISLDLPYHPAGVPTLALPECHAPIGGSPIRLKADLREAKVPGVIR